MEQHSGKETNTISIWLRLLLVAFVVNTPMIVIYYLLDGSHFDTQRYIATTGLYVPIVTLVSLALYIGKHRDEIDASLSSAIAQIEAKEKTDQAS